MIYFVYNVINKKIKRKNMLSEKQLDKIPEKNFLNFFLKEKGIECSIRYFLFGEEADNGFVNSSINIKQI